MSISAYTLSLSGDRDMDTKIAIGLPTNRGILPKTAESLLKVVASSKLPLYPIVPTKGFHTAENRTYIVAQAIKNDCSHILFTDDDMIYPVDTLSKLISYNVDVIGGLYNTRYDDPQPLIEYDGDEVSALGGGCLLIKTSVFKKIDRPWFDYEYYENGMVKMSNDWWLCRQIRKAGYKIHVDKTVNPKHASQHEY